MSFRSRKYQVFLSYSQSDQALVHWLASWMRNSGISVWIDEHSLPANSSVAAELLSQMEQCQGFLLFVSRDAMDSPWVQAEIQQALHQATANPAFSFTIVRLDQTEFDGKWAALKQRKWINANVEGNKFSPLTLVQIVNAVFNRRPASLQPDSSSVDVYISRSDNNESECTEANNVCEAIVRKSRLRLVGDSLDQERFDLDRIKLIMGACSGHVLILPKRDSESKYKYYLREFEAGRALNLTSLVLYHDGCPVPQAILANSSYQMPLADFDRHLDTIEQFHADVRATRSLYQPAVFFAHQYEANISRNRAASELIASVTGHACRTGSDYTGSIGMGQIIDGIDGCSWFLADLASSLTEKGRLSVNINSCIEAGLAIGLGFGREPRDECSTKREIHALCQDRETERTDSNDRGKTYDLPFMLRSILTIEFYRDEPEFLSLVHRLARRYRRRIINDELT